MATEKERNVTPADFSPFDERHYKELWRRQVVRLLLSYLAPLVVAVGYFTIQYDQLASESRQLELEAIAGSHANTLNLFLLERLTNLETVIGDPDLLAAPSAAALEAHLGNLQRINRTFVDLGYFDPDGVQVAYAGPYPDLANRDYNSEAWYQTLLDGPDSYLVTDVYLGFRQQPHFTLAVKTMADGYPVVLRATLDPARIHEYLRSLPEAREVYASIVNEEGKYQLANPDRGTPMGLSSIVPPATPRLGIGTVEAGPGQTFYAYAWLQMARWALIVQPTDSEQDGGLAARSLRIPLFATPIIVLVCLLVLVRARKLVALERDADRTRAQLEHAAKLASVGELAAGIAHEINNPLAVINEQAGLIKDLMDPAFGDVAGPDVLRKHLDAIQDAVFRCRDVTHRLLKFVRRTDVELQQHDVHHIIDSVVDGLLGRELAVSAIELVYDYAEPSLELVTDRNQLQQVLLNIVNNAIDAIDNKPGKLTISTRRDGKWIRIGIADTGKGMTQDQIGKIFLPFYSTKEVGKGTGLGLSVSYGIVKDFGGEIEVESTPGVGSRFTVVLPATIGKGSRQSTLGSGTEPTDAQDPTG